MKKVFKYPLDELGVTEITVPGQGKVLHFGEQNGKLFVWIMVSAKLGESETKIRIFTYWTGEAFMANNLQYIGTVVGSELVTHAFQEK